MLKGLGFRGRASQASQAGADDFSTVEKDHAELLLVAFIVAMASWAEHGVCDDLATRGQVHTRGRVQKPLKS